MTNWNQEKTKLDPKLDATIIIPTYNRSESLRATLRSVIDLDHPKDRFEVVVVDNNSTDNTQQVVETFRESLPNLTCIAEGKLSFTAARHTGASAARSNVLAYIDDDVLLSRGWLTNIVKQFASDNSIGIVAGRIEPTFVSEPPDWALAAQEVFNGWSLWRPADHIQDTEGACGPSLAVRGDVLEAVGGFPPDTLGVESSGKEATVEKIYVGPGDWGLNRAVKDAGFRIVFDPEVLVHHVIPEVRMTRQWWRSRLVGEGYMYAITLQVWESDGRRGALKRAVRSFGRCLKSLAKLLLRPRRYRDAYRFELSGNWARARVELALAIRPDVAEELWKAGISGVQPTKIHELIGKLP